MSASSERRKLINAILFFAATTKNCGKIKLFKLLYLLDFEHFSQTGLSVTGLEYQAWEKGPVPRALYDEWSAPGEDMSAAFSVKAETMFSFTRQTVVPKVGVDEDVFTKRELRVMKALAEKYHDAKAEPMVDATHVANGAWAKVWEQNLGNDQVIPYSLAVADDDPRRRAVMDTADEYSRFIV